MKRKTVEFTVEFYSKEKELVYAVLFEGYITRSFFYLHQASATNGFDHDRFFKVAAKHTYYVRGQSLSNPDEYRSLMVDDEVGLNDPRLIAINRNHPAIPNIRKAVAKLNENRVKKNHVLSA